VTNTSAAELPELISGILDKGACSRDRTGRLFNRRMVREAEERAKKAWLKDKRSKAGWKGAQTTALNYFGKEILPRPERGKRWNNLSNNTSIKSPSREPRAREAARPQGATNGKLEASPELIAKLNGERLQ
jgi:hypothetical protein